LPDFSIGPISWKVVERGPSLEMAYVIFLSSFSFSLSFSLSLLAGNVDRIQIAKGPTTPVVAPGKIRGEMVKEEEK